MHQRATVTALQRRLQYSAWCNTSVAHSKDVHATQPSGKVVKTSVAGCVLQKVLLSSEQITPKKSIYLTMIVEIISVSIT